MIALSRRLLLHRPGASVATLIALTLGALILTAMGVLVESGLRHHPAPARYAAADLVVARTDTTFTQRELGETRTSTVALPEGGSVPVALAGRIRALPGVAAVTVDEAVMVGGRPVGRSWPNAALTGDRLETGRPPEHDGEAVVGATAGKRPGDRVELLVGGTLRTYEVSGVTTGEAVFFTTAEAAELAPRRGTAAAIGVRAAPGADVGQLRDRIAALAGDARVLTRADSGLAERSPGREAARLLVEIGASFAGYAALLIVFVVAATVGLAVRHRRRDLALLRAVGATPGQVRRMIVIECLLACVPAGLVGVPAGLAAARWLTGELTLRGFLPDGFPMLPGVLAAPAALLIVAGSAMLAGLLAARRATGIRPAEALGEAAAEPVTPGRGRRIAGLVVLGTTVPSSIAAAGAGGQTAMGAAVGTLYLFVLAVALLAPWINAAAARLLTTPLQAVSRTSGYLAAANLRANARGGATVLTSLVLAVGFGGSVWFLQDNLERQAVAQHRAGLLASRALIAPAGLSRSAVADVRAIAAVRATPVRHTSVVVSVFGDATTVPARAVDATVTGVLDLDVVDGSLADLGEDTVAVSATRAGTLGWKLGERVDLRLGDGTPVRPRVVAVYRRGLGFGDVVLPLATVEGHTASNLDDQVLISVPPSAATDAALRRVAAAHPGSTLVDATGLHAGLAGDLALSAWLNRLLIGVMIVYIAVAAGNTMIMTALSRRREFALLRLSGVTRRQVRRMVDAEQAGLLGTALLLGVAVAAFTLTSVVRALTGSPAPYIPATGALAVLAGTALLALGTTVWPVAKVLRTPPIEHMGVRE